MKVMITAVNEVFFDGVADSVSVPAANGMLTILPMHMPLITPLKKGTITVREKGGIAPKEFPVNSGVMEVCRDGATIIL